MKNQIKQFVNFCIILIFSKQNVQSNKYKRKELQLQLIITAYNLQLQTLACTNCLYDIHRLNTNLDICWSDPRLLNWVYEYDRRGI